MAAVREAIGGWGALRVDANGAWSVDDAVHAIRSIEEHDLELVEQPCGSLRELAGGAPAGVHADRGRRVDRLPARPAPGGGARRLRRGEREARHRRRLQARPRAASGSPLLRPRRLPVEHARRSLGNRRGASARGSRGADARLRARHARPLRLPGGGRAGAPARRDARGAHRSGPRRERRRRGSRRGTVGALHPETR